MILPKNVSYIISKLEQAGFEAYAVGGCVRDTLLDRKPQDWDITTSAKPLQIKELFKKTIDTGIQHGTVTVMLDHVGYEVTTYRIDGEYEDNRHPKKVEFNPYNDVPHLLSPVITDGDLANKALKVIVEMMDRRYDLFGELGVRNITAYNEYVKNHEDDHLKVLPRIVIIIDELADLMLVAAKEVEASIQRITQLARAAGIHLIVATQRPSVDVITGVIKANIPSRIAFAVSQAVDSRTILDQAGAERLLGNGDMLYLPNGETSPRRIQGVFIKDEEVNNICAFVKSQAMPKYDDAFIQLKDLQNQGNEAQNVTADPLYEEVKRFVIASRKASTSLIQRKFSVGYSRAARLMDVLEANGIIGPSRGSKPREILVQNTLEDDIDSI